MAGRLVVLGCCPEPNCRLECQNWVLCHLIGITEDIGTHRGARGTIIVIPVEDVKFGKPKCIEDIASVSWVRKQEVTDQYYCENSLTKVCLLFVTHLKKQGRLNWDSWKLEQIQIQYVQLFKWLMQLICDIWSSCPLKARYSLITMIVEKGRVQSISFPQHSNTWHWGCNKYSVDLFHKHKTDLHRQDTKNKVNFMKHIRVFHKVRITRHQNPEFGSKPGEIPKKTCKKYISLQGGVKLRNAPLFVPSWVSTDIRHFLTRLSFFWAPSLLQHMRFNTCLALQYDFCNIFLPPPPFFVGCFKVRHFLTRLSFFYIYFHSSYM